jgi:NAD(P)-dependent dehydrogenase (short-subunit alcohol dehydrogenase family)
VSNPDDLDPLFAEITERSGRLDIVVANAGVGDSSTNEILSQAAVHLGPIVL